MDDIATSITWFLIVLFIVAPFFRMHASYVLWKALRVERKNNLPTGATLERFIVASTGSVASVILAALGLIRGANLLGLSTYEVPQPFGIIGLGVALMLMMIPAFVWEAMYQTGRLER